MRVYDLIAKKRDGGTHSREELEQIVNGYVRSGRADQQNRGLRDHGRRDGSDPENDQILQTELEITHDVPNSQ